MNNRSSRPLPHTALMPMTRWFAQQGGLASLVATATATTTDGLTRRRWCRQAAGGLLSGLAAGGLQAFSPAPSAPSPALGSPVRWPRVQLLDGTWLQPAEHSAQAWVVVFFATWCPYCLRHNQRLQALLPMLRARGVQVLAVAHDRQAEVVRRHLQVHQLQLPVTLDEAALHAALSPRRVTPLTCVVDHHGRLVEVIPGEMTESDLAGLARWAQG